MLTTHKTSPPTPPIPNGLSMEEWVSRGPLRNATPTATMMLPTAAIQIKYRHRRDGRRPSGNRRNSKAPASARTGIAIQEENQAMICAPCNEPGRANSA